MRNEGLRVSAYKVEPKLKCKFHRHPGQRSWSVHILFFQGRKAAGSEFHFSDHQRRRVHLHLQQRRGHTGPGGDLPGGSEEEVKVCGRSAGQPQPQWVLSREARSAWNEINPVWKRFTKCRFLPQLERSRRSWASGKETWSCWTRRPASRSSTLAGHTVLTNEPIRRETSRWTASTSCPPWPDLSRT